MVLEQYIKRLIKKNIFPGISLLVAREDKILFKQFYGNKSLIPLREVLFNDCIYDLASLTKPLITAVLILKLWEEGKFALEDKVNRFLKGFSPGVKIIHLLTHTSGLPAWYPLYLYGDEYLEQIQHLKLEYKPGNRINYSCLGYIVLFDLIRKITGEYPGKLADELIINPLKLKNTFLKLEERNKEHIAPTESGNLYERKKAGETDPEKSAQFKWRKEIICGETHDVNSFNAGGCCGNAGLFSSTGDLALLTKEIYPSLASVLKPETAELFWKNFTRGKFAHRTIGFKKNSSLISSGGSALERNAIGHNGFTGTSIWMEPKSQLRFIILSNRVHPKVNEKVNLNRIRRKIHSFLKRMVI